jgi:hypothetical protein
MTTKDTIGVVRAHRWVSLAEQDRLLQADGCRIIVSLGGGPHKLVTFDDLLKFARPGTVFKFAHAFYLADIRKLGAEKLRASYRQREKQLVDGKGSIIKDLESGLTTEQTGHRKAMLALTDDQIARHAKGARSASISAARKGLPQADFTPQQFKDAKAIWRNTKDYPTWGAAGAALEEIVSPNGHEFTTARAFKLWSKRY